MAGTCITAETFEGWKTAFLAEVDAEKRKTQAIKEAKKGGRLTGTPKPALFFHVHTTDTQRAGRELFEKDQSLRTSDLAMTSAGTADTAFALVADDAGRCRRSGGRQECFRGFGS